MTLIAAWVGSGPVELVVLCSADADIVGGVVEVVNSTRDEFISLTIGSVIVIIFEIYCVSRGRN